jgi:hypothetical protein
VLSADGMCPHVCISLETLRSSQHTMASFICRLFQFYRVYLLVFIYNLLDSENAKSIHVRECLLVGYTIFLSGTDHGSQR